MVHSQVPTFLAVLVLCAHFIADFVMQTNGVATLKSQSFRWLTIHVVVYGVGLAANTVALLCSVSLEAWLVWLGVNLVAHWLTDAVTSRGTAALKRAGETHWFFVVIGLDQLIHGVTLLVTLSYLLN